ncbi:MAG: SDR family NAD(P)-dependent oxidoreductase, partial [Duganella sp.]
MDNSKHNYLQPWGCDIAQAFRGAWNGALAADAVAALFDPALVFHFHARQLHGVDAYRQFIATAHIHASELDMEPELVLTRDDKVMLIYRWRSLRWHPDIAGGKLHSNYCKVVLQVRDGRITDIWQQTPDFLFLLGKLPLAAPMQYPQVVQERLLACVDGAIEATDDPSTAAMCTLFQRMNDCFLNRSSLRNMRDIQNQDIVYDTGGSQGVGVQSWKTFVYALHTCLGEHQGTRFDDFYLRDGDRLRVFLRATVEQPSPYILRCADGLIAAMKLRVRDGRIAAIETQMENYLQFLDTDFNHHQQRLRQLFQGQRQPVQEARADAVPPSPSQLDQVAIVGMAGRFPQCDSVQQLWQALAVGRTLVTAIPDTPVRNSVCAGTQIGHAALIDGVEYFDHGYFQMLPDEVRFIDPQQRLLLQEIVHSMNDSGHALATFGGPRTGLFIANLSADYQKLLHDQGWINDAHTWAGNEQAMFAARVARVFNIQGPCRLVNAECTSSLVALHEAARLIRSGEIDQAIVGATNLLLHPYGFAARSGTLLTEQEQARLFSKDSDGQLRGEAIVSVVLKSLARAEADGDRIYGIVAGSAVNNSGKTLSLAAGHVAQQVAVMQAAWKQAGIAPQALSLIECHASGVRGGDFAEIAAIKSALAGDVPRLPLRLATSKAATGHAEAASGLVSLVKVVLQLQHGMVAGVHGLEQIDPDLGLDPQRFVLSPDAAPWQRHDGAPRVAGINGFAAGGYNAHVVIREYLGSSHGQEQHQEHDCDRIVLLSAQSETSLQAQLRAVQAWLANHPQTALAPLAFSLRQRDALRWRAAFVPDDMEDLQRLLALALNGQTSARGFLGRRDKPGVELAAAGVPLEVAAAWAQGANIRWPATASARRPRLTDLPPYPFDARPCWLPPARSGAPAMASASKTAVSRLSLRSIASAMTTDQQHHHCYALKLRGDEPWLAGHVVEQRVLVPGVAYLEMVWAAASAALETGGSDIALHNVAWLQPIVCDPSQLKDKVADHEIRIELVALQTSAQAGQRLAFTITSDSEPARVHCQGQVQSGAAPLAPAPTLAALQAACSQKGPEANQLYAAYRQHGFDYGDGYRAVTALHTDGSGQWLAQLAAPQLEENTQKHGWVLHPWIMDAALHATAVLTLAQHSASPSLALPFAIEHVHIAASTTAHMWAWIRAAEGAAADARVQKYDIDLFDDSGRRCVALAGFSVRVAAASPMRERTFTTPPPALPLPLPASAINASETAVLDLLRSEVAGLLQVAVDEISPEEELSAYGFDSINLTSLGNRLNDEYRLPPERPLNPTIFFEYPSLKAFARYLARHYPEAVAQRHPLAPAQQAPAASTAAPAPASAPPSPSGKRIAIVGVSASFPQAQGLAQFWDNLLEGRDCISEVPAGRWDWRAMFGDPATEPHKTDVKWGGFIDGIADFDPLFFGISPREAELMDPQHRLLLQHAWHAIEDAGYNPRSLSGSRTGVFMATAHSGYSDLLAQAGLAVDASTITGMVPSVAANRISYLLNLHGPSEPVETACSSALVAIHRAMAAMDAGHCDMALVGAVNTLVTADGHIGFRKAGMLCEDGRCKTFARGANGYVRGEGVGVLLLKRLGDAERAGDPVHAVLLASAENHGGRAHSLTAPNPNAQADLIRTAMTGAGVDPRSVGYIEAHGTGTALGDPIEINGLKSAYATLYRDHGVAPPAQPHCGLASVKSNIGHLELAAGMAGVIKVLLQMRHNTLVRSLHVDELNPYLELEGSPFFIVRENQAWPAPVDSEGRALARRAGVSSFGFGGANAHVVLEQYCAPASDVIADGRPHIIVLSARNAAQLRDAVQALHAASQQMSDADLPAMAATLQLGREAMVHRLALVVTSLAQLRERLEAVLAERAAGMPDIYHGSAKAQHAAVALLQSDEEWRVVVSGWLERGKYRQVLALWVHGLELDWTPVYHGQPPRRMALPGYPFARERCWVPAPETRQLGATAGGSASPMLHPLLQRNVSDFSAQRYRSTFHGREFFLRDHVVMGLPVLPAAAYLEMVRAALADAQDAKHVQQGWRLRDVAWLQPLMLAAGEGAMEVEVTLTPSGDGQIAFVVSSGRGSESRLHCQGHAAHIHIPPGDQPAPDLSVPAHAVRFDAAAVYQQFAAMGIGYGPAHRPLHELCVDGDTQQVLAHLRLPAQAREEGADYVLHPAMLDGALQAGIGFLMPKMGKDGAVIAAPLPFHLRQLDVLAPCTAQMTVRARHSPLADGAGAPDQASMRLDIDLYDDAGRLCVQIGGFASRSAAGQSVPQAATRTGSLPPPLSNQPHGLLLAPVWEPLTGQPQDGAVLTPRSGEKVLLLAPDSVRPALQALWPQALDGDAINGVDHVVWAADDGVALAPDSDALLAAQDDGVYAVFHTIKNLLDHGYGSRALAWTFITTGAAAVRDGECVNPTHAGVRGLAGTLAREYPGWSVRMIDLAQGWSTEDCAQVALPTAFRLPAGEAVLRGGVHHQRKLAPLHVLERVAAPRLRESGYRSGGVYLVIGGAGGIGALWTEYVMRHYQARVVWIGRRPADEAIGQLQARLAQWGEAPLYLAADATCRTALAQARETVLARYGRIDGLVQAAAVLHDRSLASMNQAEFGAVYASKAETSVRLAQVFAGDALDFVLCFSSLVAFACPPGQANYVAGCAFQDAWAQALAAHWPCTVKVMNWGYWGGVGVAASDDYRERMARIGVGSISAAEGMDALEILLADAQDQHALVNVTRPLAELAQGVYAGFLAGAGQLQTMLPVPQTETTQAAQPADLAQLITEVLSAALKVDAADIDPDEPFTAYGVDSITGVQLAQTLNRRLGLELDVTLFFDHGTVHALTHYLLQRHGAALAARDTPVTSTSAAPAAVTAGQPGKSAHRLMTKTVQLPVAQDRTTEGIAIIGLSAAFPMADGPEALWRLLQSGGDAVSEVPPQRWDWKQVGGAGLTEAERECLRWGAFLDDVALFDA